MTAASARRRTSEHILSLSVHDTGTRFKLLAAQEVGESDSDGVRWAWPDGLWLPRRRHTWSHSRWRSRLSLLASLGASLRTGLAALTTLLPLLLLLHLLKLGYALGLDVLDELRNRHAMLLGFGGQLGLHCLDLLRRRHGHSIGAHGYASRSSWSGLSPRSPRSSRSAWTSVWILHGCVVAISMYKGELSKKKGPGNITRAMEGIKQGKWCMCLVYGAEECQPRVKVKVAQCCTISLYQSDMELTTCHSEPWRLVLLMTNATHLPAYSRIKLSVFPGFNRDLQCCHLQRFLEAVWRWR
jgi:hypothetical protein